MIENIIYFSRKKSLKKIAMKKFLLITVLALASVVAMPQISTAQSGFFKRASDSKTIDTLTDAQTRNMQLQIAGFQKVVTIQPLITKIGGTAAATVVLYGSTDGTNYVRLQSLRTDGTTRLDTLAVTNVAGVQSKGFIVHDSPYSYYRIAAIGSGTQTTQVKAFAIWRNN